MNITMLFNDYYKCVIDQIVINRFNVLRRVDLNNYCSSETGTFQKIG